MTNKNPEPPIKPQVIDLDAEDIVVEDTIVEDANTPSPPPPSAPPKKPVTSTKWLVVALLGGAAIGAWVYKDFLSGYLPSDQLAAAQSRIDTLEAQTKTLAEQVAAISAASDQLKSQVGSFATDIHGVTDTTAGYESRIAATEAVAKATKAEIEKLKLGAPSSGGTTVEGSALAVLAQRLDALEKDVASLKTVSAPTDQSAATAALTQSLADLKAKIAGGAPYRDELDRVSRMVPAAAGLDTLAAHAAEGLPTASGLAKELADIIPLLPKPEFAVITPDGSYTDGFWKMMRGLITIRKIGEADWPSLAAQCAALAESGDLVQAIEKIDRAEGAKPSAISGWRDRATARISLEAAMEETSKAVLRQITSMGATP
jgi:hypothetical protein